MAALAAFYDRFPGDESIAGALQAIDVPAFGGFLDAVNWLGDARVHIPLTLAAVLAFVYVRAGWEALLVLLTFLPRWLSGPLRELIERPRPPPELVEITGTASGFSFPSGHTLGTAVLFGVLFFLIPAGVAWRPARWLLQAGCLLAVLAAGPARVYVGVHWPSDVAGAYLLALLIVAPAITLYLTAQRQDRRR